MGRGEATGGEASKRSPQPDTLKPSPTDQEDPAMTQLATGSHRRDTRVGNPRVRGQRTKGEQAALAGQPTTLLAWAIWLGLATGLLELVFTYIRWRFVDASALGVLQ